MADAGKRPFWMHQLVEYILGAALVATGLQTPYPVVPAVLGGIIMGHAAITSGALAAFRVIDRRVHRFIDPAIIGLEIVAAVQPWVEVDPGTRLIIGGIAAVHTFVWLGSSYTEKPKKAKKGTKPDATAPAAAGTTSAASAPTTAPPTPKPAAPAEPAATEEKAADGRSADIGRSAGRMAASGVNAVRRAKDKRANK